MALSIQQDTKYPGNGRWQWSVWVEGEHEELNRIDHVVYILHSTFHNPVRRINDRSTKFRLDTSGWGTFTIHAKAVHQDGSEETLQHDLVLAYPDGTPTAA
jgi:transcription initiation factor IIF auxiliary subunit